jgi:hypothetical protein
MGAEQVHVDQQSSPQDKIALFRSLFRGREDVFPRRFESRKTGKSGYAPACANEWVRGVCEKPRVKCAECDHRRFLPVTDDIIRWHLSGHDDAGQPFVAGVYPMLQDESCFFLAIDFDKQDWQQDVSAFLETCRELKLPVALERSRSGRGGHVWFFFAEAIPAALARKLGSFLLTETMERRPDIGLDSYDRLFPNQDTLPQGGFGNLIAMPLQKQAREHGNNVFVDDRLEPHADQWAFLSSITKLTRSQLERAVENADRRVGVVGVRLPALDEDEPEPWAVSPSRRPKASPIVGDLPTTLEVVLGNEIYVPTDGLVPGLRNRLIRIAAFQNPEFYKAQAMRLPTYDKPRVIACAEQHPHHLGLPRDIQPDERRAVRHVHGHDVARRPHHLRPVQQHAGDVRRAGGTMYAVRTDLRILRADRRGVRKPAVDQESCSSRRSHSFAIFQSRATVSADMPITSAVSSTVSPPK